MKFPKEYFFDEVRDGFYISGMMKRFWAAQLEVLQVIDRVCKKYDIRYFADCGTLLGAVRHGGYIPWDDDLDICMLRDDYKKFHRLAVRDLPDEYVVMTHDTEDYWQMITRVVNHEGIKFDQETLDRYHGCPYCAGVDIFVLDYLAPDENEEEVRRKLVESVVSIGWIEGIGGADPPELGLELISEVEEQCDVKLDRKNNLRRQLFDLGEKLSALYPSEGAKDVVLMPYWTEHHDHRYSISDFEKLIDIPYENTFIKVPAKYADVLRVEYGNYMRIVKTGGEHDYPLYQKQEDLIGERLGLDEPFRYKFDPADLEKKKDAMPLRLADRVAEFCSLMRNMQAMLPKVLEGGDAQSVYGALIRCQENAIQIGNGIEEERGEGSGTVGRIEEYCEQIFLAAQCLEQGEMPDWAALGSALDAVDQTAKEELRERRKILFIPFRAQYWDMMESIWREAVSDPVNEVYVMPLPCHEKNFFGERGADYKDPQPYPPEVTLSDPKSIDIARMHPDVIYTQYAYDKYHYTFGTEVEYYTSRLKRCTEELVYVPWFRLGEVEAEDERLRTVASYFVRIPGLMHADKVLLESENVRDFYMEVLMDFCGEDTKELWEEKLQVCELPAATELSVPEAWKALACRENGERKKMMVLRTTVSSMYQYKERALDKLERILDTFYENREELCLIWCPHPAIRDSKGIFPREMWDRYEKIVDRYQKDGWGILAQWDEADPAPELADAYYGDPDAWVQKFRNQKKAIMLANYEI